MEMEEKGAAKVTTHARTLYNQYGTQRSVGPSNRALVLKLQAGHLVIYQIVC